jgi:hypothetical protein
MKTTIQKLILSLMWLALPMLAQAQFTYTTNSGAITITGYTGSGGAVVIPATTNGYPVISIGNSAFEGNLNMTSVIIPDSVTSIGYLAFNFCTSLTNVTIGNNVTSIGDFAFANCASLTNMIIGNGVTSIGGDAFVVCTNLISIIIPNSVTNIGGFAFVNCTSLTSVTIGKGVTSLGDYAFRYCPSLTTAYFLGNAPFDYGDAFTEYDPVTVFYMTGATGWSSTFGGAGTELWNPQAIAPGFTGGQFGFNLTGIPYAGIVIEACTNLSNPVWLPVATNSHRQSIFIDPSNYPSRFYRFRSP